MTLGAMWMSGRVADHAIQLRRDVASMQTSEHIDRKQEVVMEKSNYDEALYEEIEISDYEDEDEEKSLSFKKSVKKVYIQLKNAKQKYAKTAMKHFIAYIVRRLYNAMGDSWYPTKRQTNIIDDTLAERYEPWFTISIKVAHSHWEDAVRKGNAEYWLNTIKLHLNDELIQNILEDLPMCLSAIEKIEGDKMDRKKGDDKGLQKKEKKVQKNKESKGKSTEKDDDSDFETESEKSSKKKGK